MKLHATKRIRGQREQGYALLLMMFFLALLVLSTVVAAPTVLSSIQREKEKEMVWRGKQYTRGIRMYYTKMRRFPTSLEQLTKGENNIRFMRQAYKDPMNPEGTWRLIYIGPNGQLIGSLNYQAIGLFGGNPQAMAAAAAQNAAMSGGSTLNSAFGGTAIPNNPSPFANNSGLVPMNSQQGQGDGSSSDPNAQNGDASDEMGQPHSLGTMDASNTIGGNIIGVGGTINKKSFLWYQRAKTYRRFEFIWDPSKDMLTGPASRGIGTQIGTPSTPGMGAPGTVAPSMPNNNPGQSNMGNPGDSTPLQAPPSQ
jgi:type II secretory pathway pseudopilin PulG